MATCLAQFVQPALLHGRHLQIARRANLPQPWLLRRRANQEDASRHPALHHEGRFAIVTNVGCGMRWTSPCQVREHDPEPKAAKQKVHSGFSDRIMLNTKRKATDVVTNGQAVWS
jgi:hypothetical protein